MSWPREALGRQFALGLDLGAALAALFLLACGTEEETDAKPPEPAWEGGEQVDSSTGDVACSPKSCAQMGAQCGTVSDGCKRLLECGSCPAGQTCGGGGPNQCGTEQCVPRSCVQLDASCGQVSDGCSQVLECGDCVAPQTCGGGGNPNACGLNCAPPTKKCGDACVDQNDPAFGCEHPLDPSSPCAPCPTPANGAASCSAGMCSVVCESDWGDCDNELSTGCETALTSVAHCGACQHACPSGGGTAVCVDGTCDVVIPTWSYTHWRLDQPEGACGEWGKITEVKFRVGGSVIANGANGYFSGTAGGQSIVGISHTGDSASYGRAWMAFDGTGEPWQSYFSGSYYWTGGESLRLQVSQPIIAQEVLVGTFWGSTECIRLSGSNDGANWTILGTSCNTDCNSVLVFKP